MSCLYVHRLNLDVEASSAKTRHVELKRMGTAATFVFFSSTTMVLALLDHYQLNLLKILHLLVAGRF